METFKGTVKKSDLEGGLWIFETDEGEVYNLQGGPKNLYEDGKKVTISGEVPKDIMGIGMMGPVLKVQKIV